MKKLARSSAIGPPGLIVPGPVEEEVKREPESAWPLWDDSSVKENQENKGTSL